MAAPARVGPQDAPGRNEPIVSADGSRAERSVTLGAFGRHVGLDNVGLLMEAILEEERCVTRETRR